MTRGAGASYHWSGEDTQGVNVEAFAEAVMQAGVKLDPTRQAHLVGALYREAVNGRRPSSASVAATLKALSG